MNLIFLRHGEATDNIKELISDKEIYWSILTKDGKKSVEESIKSLPEKIDKIYVSPFPRTIQTASLLYEKKLNVEVIIDERLHEIKYGKFSHKKNNENLDDTRIKQKNGDYFIRFGEYGENKYEIEQRLCEFLTDVYENNMKDNTIVVVSHGSIISYLKRILKIESSHIKTGEIEIINNVDFSQLKKHIKELNCIKNKEISKRMSLIEKFDGNNIIKNQLKKIAKNEFNNIEFTYEILEKYILGYNTNSLIRMTKTKFDKSAILICFYCNFENFAKEWMDHYIKIGIKNFVLIDNNSNDKSSKILYKYANKVNIDFWKLNEKYDCNKMCGWKQKIFDIYGNNKYITVDSDELIIYKNYKNISLNDYISLNKIKNAKALMLDTYSNKELFCGNIKDYKYVDKQTYKMTNSIYGQRFYGGPRSRKFGINPSLQKLPIISYTGKELFANDHYYYPFSINKNAKFCLYLLHYKFLPGDEQKYISYVKDGRHWNNSREYKIYNEVINENNKTTFFDKEISILIDDIDYNF